MVFDLLFIAFQMPHVFLILYNKKSRYYMLIHIRRYTYMFYLKLTHIVSISLIQRLQDYNI